MPSKIRCCAFAQKTSSMSTDGSRSQLPFRIRPSLTTRLIGQSSSSPYSWGDPVSHRSSDAWAGVTGARLVRCAFLWSSLFSRGLRPVGPARDEARATVGTICRGDRWCWGRRRQGACVCSAVVVCSVSLRSADRPESVTLRCAGLRRRHLWQLWSWKLKTPRAGTLPSCVRGRDLLYRRFSCLLQHPGFLCKTEAGVQA